MTVEAGHFALVLALIASAAQGAGAFGVSVEGARAVMARRAALLYFVLSSLAFASLLHAFAVCDFSVSAVVANGHTQLPLRYRLSAAWGNHEGSMLLWLWVTGLWGALLCLVRDSALRTRALGVMGLLGFGFTAFVLFASNPFLRLYPAPLEGMGLNPLLQDPALSVHPPLLYTGYVGFAAAFSLAAAGMLERAVNADFARVLRPYVLGAWGFLTAGIAMGSLWAYYELGWGGFWFWDPVENASLMPWLSGTALLHALAVTARRGSLRGWTVFLCVLTFTLSILGTFLVRSGLLTSVHAFASDPTRGIFILVLLALYGGGGFLLYALRPPEAGEPAPFPPFSRESMMLVNGAFLFSFCATVFAGTLYPVFMTALGLEAVSVGPPYYAASLLPLLAPFALAMGVGPHANWQGGGAGRTLLWLFPVALGVLAAPVLPAAAGVKVTRPEIFGHAIAAWIALATLVDLLRRGFRRGKGFGYYGMILAHLGFAVLIAGATGATQRVEEQIKWMSPGDTLEIAGGSLALLTEESGIGDTYNYERAVFAVEEGVEQTVYLLPERRWYPAAEQETAEAVLLPLRGGVLYLALGEREKGMPPHRRVVRAWYHPLVILIYIGAAMMALGAALGLLAGVFRREAGREGAA